MKTGGKKGQEWQPRGVVALPGSRGLNGRWPTATDVGTDLSQFFSKGLNHSWFTEYVNN